MRGGKRALIFFLTAKGISLPGVRTRAERRQLVPPLPLDDTIDNVKTKIQNVLFQAFLTGVKPSLSRLNPLISVRLKAPQLRLNE